MGVKTWHKHLSSMVLRPVFEFSAMLYLAIALLGEY
jgi:hypothetical protein